MSKQLGEPEFNVIRANRIAGVKCENCGCPKLLTVLPGIADAEIAQAFWLFGWMQLRHGPWLCWFCTSSHADHGLREAAQSARECHAEIRIAEKWIGKR